MHTVTPTEAARLADEIYLVRNERRVDDFLNSSLFKQSHRAKPLKAEVGGRLLLNHQDAFGVCAHGANRYQGDVFLIFRGTTTANSGADFLTDARIGLSVSSGGVPVHSGFEHCFSSMLPQIKGFFAQCKAGIRTVHCIGHSLGGAIASLAADWVARTLHHSTRLYTFGAPRVGTEQFAKRTTAALTSANIHRVYHRTDPVSLVPLYPFMHAPFRETGHYIHSNEPLLSGVAHGMVRYIKSVEGLAWAQINEKPEQPYTLESAIEGWLESKSPVDTSSATFWRWLDSALIHVISKVASAAAVVIQATFIGAFTIADKLAYILKKGIDLTESISRWVLHLIRRMMQALNMTAKVTRELLTQNFIRSLLERLMRKAHREARNALRNL
ncbi:lipase family protein [Marinimicrobium alkaliphilum]|uniref:lipase family protein n=1 Tax=Marinimicrobium alkaliphilum TaxID=2202654 RepID=UPI000DBA9DD9|nr:lipase family protein [Marinimicrobium alkaliphilum]